MKASFPPKPALVEAASFANTQTRAEFLNGIDHELRTPLNVIIGMCQFLERDRETPLSPMHRDAVDRMERNARTLLQSVNELLKHLRNGDSSRSN